jgi:hypothetical protein
VSGIVIAGGTSVGGTDSRNKKCFSCGVVGGRWSKTVDNGHTVWTHECGAQQ